MNARERLGFKKRTTANPANYTIYIVESNNILNFFSIYISIYTI